MLPVDLNESGDEVMMQLGEINEPLLVFGGPYSNLAATRAMQQRAETLGIPPQRVICTGDLVAYCAEPVETVTLLRQWGCHLLMGNCEESLAAGAVDCGCGFDEGSACSLLAVDWYRYAQQRLDADCCHWMGRLPRVIGFTLQGKRYRVVHGSVSRINEFIFASSDPLYKQQQLDLAGADVVLAGHCGLPFGQALERGYWLNAGVIGMPANDARTGGWYLLLTPQADGTEARWERLDYDPAPAVARMAQENLSPVYAQALQTGLWPNQDILPAIEQAQQGKALSLRPILIR
ncbi:metallophosphoesterase family protein [Neptuniibacter halophilus]|uniref:metallophosphoesterase family protein n=1 Tax=Neptuniibacter halophilus TaxID=651666 RepID=UPI0025737599|nr:metallophosphoesterase family protein [Neptuniibacter halophilus]